MCDQQRQKAEAFLQLHHGPELLVLPNAWDVASARVYERASFRAVGTTSSGIAASLGYLDGERIPVAEMLEVIERIVRSTGLPVNADIEAGYGKDGVAVAETVRRVTQAGVAGINMEDGTGEPELPLSDMAFHVEKLEAARKAADTEGVPLVINARTDTYLVPFPDPEAQFRETVQRANAYWQAGADCIFIPGCLDGTIIARLVAAIDAPLNIFASPVTPSIPELKDLGVARLSIGAGGFRAALANVRKIATELAEHGTYGTLFGETLTRAEVDALLMPSTSRA